MVRDVGIFHRSVVKRPVPALAGDNASLSYCIVVRHETKAIEDVRLGEHLWVVHHGSLRDANPISDRDLLPFREREWQQGFAARGHYATLSGSKL